MPGEQQIFDEVMDRFGAEHAEQERRNRDARGHSQAACLRRSFGASEEPRDALFKRVSAQGEGDRRERSGALAHEPSHADQRVRHGDPAKFSGGFGIGGFVRGGPERGREP
jgi:hypothetical protein